MDSSATRLDPQLIGQLNDHSRCVTLADLPKELLDKILGYVESFDYIPFLLSCKTVYHKCHLTLFRLKPVRLQYTGSSYNFRYNRNLQTTWNLLQHMSNNPEIYAQVKVFQLKNSVSVKESVKPPVKSRNGHSRGKRFSLKVDYSKIPSSLISVLPNFVNLRYIKVDIENFTFLRDLLEALPITLKGLNININVANPRFNAKETQMPDIKCRGLKTLAFHSTSKEPMIYGKLKSRHVMKVPSRYLMEESTFSDLIREKFEHDDRSIKKQPNLKYCGEMMALLIQQNVSTFYSIDIRGIDATVIFLNRFVDCQMKNLRVIKLCNLSIPRLRWWLPTLEQSNLNKRQFMPSNSELSLPPIVVVFSKLFTSPPQNRDVQCRARFFGDPEDRWFSMGGEATEFWEEIHYQ
ncbi:hypothetical protein KL906_001448 [Ogataea polymorpha]|uniref:uncharacterized protein n=1 Tax=Ogataea polymorpha TaxID=460523 RepID=UPI0007F4023F|nr:uncharacterized protein OGAPODRAFT_13029 [Ogataea polymorpha]KAG7894079.1 hypothetical protein KL908_002356 [Ogataea polymorpha]KAG7911068.1 hypothetical protein KL906_001448 [Ogataea polymorpha]KAG7918386.1 hypothetical protein KL927_001843 [Ogataea polymorpha]KAG7931580.1 hypothetical protein KL934_003992 [Ogataea polymorpha]OBA15551.1 hypothetical protein OGAPODRAFT_13029 [Ogataea polymorpha]